ncbi:hypothetical protein MTO96_003759 [Rhipicephalus appendiculatus]
MESEKIGEGSLVVSASEMATCSASPADLVLTETALTVRPLTSTTAATKLFGPERRFLNVGYVLSTIVQDLDPTENYTLSVQWCPSQNVCSPFVSTTRIANAPKLPVPSNLTVVATGPSSINITWQLPGNSTNITGYQVSWCLSDLCIGKLNDLTTKTSYSVQRLQDFKNYTVFVCAYVDQGLTTFVGQCINVSAKTQPGGKLTFLE